MSYFNLFKTKINYFFWDLSHTLINYLFGIIVKRERQINKNCYLFIKKVNRNIFFCINDVNYTNKYLSNLIGKNIIFKINSSFMPGITLDYLLLEPILETILLKQTKFKFKLWENCTSRLIKDINRINDVCKHISSFINIKIKKLVIKVKNIKIILQNVVIIKNNNKLIIKISKINIYHKDIHIVKMKKVKMNVYSMQYISSICIDSIIVTLREINIRNNFFEEIINIFLSFPSEENSIYPKILIKNIKINLEIHNYIRFILNNIILEKRVLTINTLNIKIFKKEILWLSNFNINIDTKIPNIKNIRIRLFLSTGDKIYKSFIFLRKRYVHFDTIRQKLVIPYSYNTGNIDINYLNNFKITNSEIKVNNTPQLISIKESYLNKYIIDIINFRFKIKQLEISFEKDQGKFLIYDFLYSSGKDINTISCNKWLYLKKNIKYIDKIGNKSDFIIKFGNGIFEIIPYKCYINLDLQQYKLTFSILIKNISKITSIFTPNITNTKNYIFERFRIDSFYAVLSYTKNSFSIGNLIEGNYSEMLNLISIEGVELLLPELLILYPNNWSEIAKKIVNKYFIFMSGKNFKNIIKKTPAASILKLSKIKKSFGYLSNKIYNSF